MGTPLDKPPGDHGYTEPMAEEHFSRISLGGETVLRALLELDAFRICPPMETDAFVTWCKKCGVAVNVELLEQFEKKELFLPLLRVKFPVHRSKRRRLDGGGYEDLGALNDDEHWNGEVAESYIWPDFSRHNLLTWMDEGLLYSPESRPFVPWGEYRDTNRRKAVASYYSPFQAYTLSYQLKMTGWPLNAAYVVELSEEDFTRLKKRLKEWASWSSEPRSRLENPRFDAVLVAQAIATRYYPLARGDARTITLPGEWDWYAYAGAWNPAAVVERLGLSPADVRRYYEMLDLARTFDDPLDDWDDLLRFVKREARDRLKGKARYCEELRAMREMFGLLYKDLAGEGLEPLKGSLADRYALNEGSSFARSAELRQARAPTELDLLEFVVNRYGLNPRPALVLFVEGDGEERAIPRLLERVYGMTLAVAGIELRNLSGIAGFCGMKKRERHGALEKVIEELHLSQTVVMVVLDNEGGSPAVRERLSVKQSRYSPKRTVIRREFIHIWERNIELDNFTSEEIAAALTITADGRHTFTAEEVETAAAEFGRRGDPISELYASKVKYGLPKPTLLYHLVDDLPLDDPGASRRPLLVLLHQLVKISALNHKPTFVDTWYENQESGYLGHPLGDADARLADEFKELRAIQTHLETKPDKPEE